MRGRRWITAAAACLAVAAGVLAFYLSVYAVRGYDQPLGYDTARYLWRTNCVAAGGLSELRRCAATHAALPSRVGYPLVSLLLSAVLPVARYPLAAVLPAVAAAVIALGGAALVGWSLNLDPRRFAVIAVVVGVSPMVVAMANPEGYADTMLAVGIGLAGLLAASVVAERGKGYAPAVALVAVAAVVHSATGSVFAAVVAGVALLYVPEALAKRRAGAALTGSVSIRLGAVVGGSIALWALMIGGLVRSRPDTYRVPVADLEEKFRSHLPRLGLPVGLPAAAAGALVLARERRSTVTEWTRRRFLLTLLLVWLGIVGAALVAWFVGWKLPIHRFLLLSLPVPMLGGIALLWLGDRVAAARRGLGPMVVVAGCLTVAAAGYVLWARNAPPVLRSARLDAARGAVEYIEGLPSDRTVTVVTDEPEANPDALAQTFRVVLPEERIAGVRFSSRVPAVDPSASDRVILLLDGYARSFATASRAAPDRLVTPNVFVLSGPLPARAVAAPRGPRLGAGAPELFVWAILSMLLLGAIGIGWTSWAMPGVPFLERLAVAPGAGLAALVVDGLILDLLGARIGGPFAVVAVVASGLLGAFLAIRRGSPAAPQPGSS